MEFATPLTLFLLLLGQMAFVTEEALNKTIYILKERIDKKLEILEERIDKKLENFVTIQRFEALEQRIERLQTTLENAINTNLRDILQLKYTCNMKRTFDDFGDSIETELDRLGGFWYKTLDCFLISASWFIPVVAVALIACLIGVHEKMGIDTEHLGTFVLSIISGAYVATNFCHSRHIRYETTVRRFTQLQKKFNSDGTGSRRSAKTDMEREKVLYHYGVLFDKVLDHEKGIDSKWEL